MVTIILALFIGLAAGVASGIIGIGGGIVLVPALVFFFGMSQLKAQGTSIGALLLPVGALAFWAYYRRGEADLKIALLIAVGFAIGGYVGGTWAQDIPDLILRRIFAVVLAGVAVRMFLQ